MQFINKNQADHRLDFRKIAPTEIYIPQGIEPILEEVEKYTETIKKRGAIPDIIITAENTLVEGINQLQAAINSNQKFILARIKPGESIKNNSNFIEIEVSKLLPHPLQKKVYGDEGDIAESKVFQAIKETGDIEPITVVRSIEIVGCFRIIKGHTRTKAAIALGLERIRAYITQYSSQLEENEAFLSSNTFREETNEQKARRAAAWWEIIEQKNAQRKGTKDGAKFRTREEVGELVGWSGLTTYHALQVVRSLDTLPQEKAEEVRKKLSKSVDGAYRTINPHQQPHPQPKAKTKEKPWLPKMLDQIRVTGGQHDGKLGEVRGIMGSHCLVWLKGNPLNERQNIHIANLSPIITCNSINQELDQKAESLGLKNKPQILPEIPRNEGFDPNQATQMQASYTGLHNPVDIAIALTQLSPAQISHALALALPEMKSEQVQAINSALAKAMSKVA